MHSGGFQPNIGKDTLIYRKELEFLPSNLPSPVLRRRRNREVIVSHGELIPRDERAESKKLLTLHQGYGRRTAQVMGGDPDLPSLAGTLSILPATLHDGADGAPGHRPHSLGLVHPGGQGTRGKRELTSIVSNWRAVEQLSQFRCRIERFRNPAQVNRTKAHHSKPAFQLQRYAKLTHCIW